jgi:hypothetical protein
MLFQRQALNGTHRAMVTTAKGRARARLIAALFRVETLDGNVWRLCFSPALVQSPDRFMGGTSGVRITPRGQGVPS